MGGTLGEGGSEAALQGFSPVCSNPAAPTAGLLQ